jgi:hypothetical protein
MEAIEVSALRIGRFASPPLRQAGQSEPWTTTEVPLIEELANADHAHRIEMKRKAPTFTSAILA